MNASLLNLQLYACDDGLNFQPQSLGFGHDIASDMPVMVLVPSTHVRQLTLDVPGKHWRQALPFAVEAVVGEHPEFLHVVVQSRDASSGVTHVLVVQRGWMEHWVDQLQQQGIRPTWMVPEACVLLPDEVTRMHAGESEATVHRQWMKTPSSLGHRLLMWDESLGPLALHESMDESLLQATDADIVNFSHWQRTMSQRLVDKTQTQAWLKRLSGFNLLTGAYQRAFQSTPQISDGAWALVVSALVLWVVFLLVQQQSQRHWLTQATELQHINEAVFRQALPNQSRIVNVQTQLQQALDAIDDVDAKPQITSGFHPWLTVLIPLLNDTKAITLLRLNFDGQRLALFLTSKELNALEMFKQKAVKAFAQSQQATTVELKVTQLSNGKVEAVIYVF